MHLIIPFASVMSEGGREALSSLATPALDALLSQWQATEHDDGDEETLDMPHERAFAHAIGWSAEPPLPWAARAARADGIDVGDAAWGLVTPVHWRVGADAVHLADPGALLLDEPSSRTFFDAVRPLFDSEGFTMAWGAPLHWYVSHPALASLATASLDRVVGRNVHRWLPSQPAARPLRRLQSEVQMLLHTHPLNDQREAAGALPVNSFWLSGCGVARAEREHDAKLDDHLAAPALAEDWPAWTAAWAALDASLPSLPLTQLTLCGERGARSWQAPTSTRSLVDRMTQPFKARRPARERLATL
jgi:hypothetical protein